MSIKVFAFSLLGQANRQTHWQTERQTNWLKLLKEMWVLLRISRVTLTLTLLLLQNYSVISILQVQVGDESFYSHVRLVRYWQFEDAFCLLGHNLCCQGRTGRADRCPLCHSSMFLKARLHQFKGQRQSCCRFQLLIFTKELTSLCRAIEEQTNNLECASVMMSSDNCSY